MLLKFRILKPVSRTALAAALVAPAAVAAQDGPVPATVLEAPSGVSVETQNEARETGPSKLNDEIIVTAQKRSAALQDVPLAISAFAGDALADRGIDDISALESYVPALHVGQEQDGFKISIRGIGLQGTSAISDSGVAFYQDGFYIPRPSGGAATFFDVNRVEVLRGPQGTLYGRNATGGVVNVISNEPVFDFEGQVGVTYGERNLFEARGVINAPLSDNLAVRVSAVYFQEDGYTEQLTPGLDNLSGRDGDINIRGQILYAGPDDSELLLSVSHTELNGSGVPLKFLERNIGGPGPVQPFLAQIPTDDPDPLRIATNTPSLNDTNTTIGFLRFTRPLGGVDLFFQGGYLKQDTELVQDVDGSALDISAFYKTLDNEAGSAELRLASNGGGALDWIAGVYYFEEVTDLVRRVTLNGVTPAGQLALPDFLLTERGESQTAAVFGSATYHISDAFSLTGGVRYTDDKRSGTKITLSNFGAPISSPDLFDVEVTYSRVTWNVGGEWKPNNDFLGYASVSNGYKAGGFNLTSSGEPYAPEDVIAYEIGFKSNPLDGKMQINVDAFYYDYKDLQLSNLTTVNNAPGQLVTNAAGSTVFGIEAGGWVDLTPDFRVNLNYTYIDATFDEYFNRDPRDNSGSFNPDDPLGLGRPNLAGNRLPYVSKHTVSAGLSYTTEVGPSSDLTFAINTNFHSDLFLREFNDPFIDRQAANTQTDANVNYSLRDLGLELSAFVTNIENNTERNNIQVSPGFIGQSALAIYTKPRTWGLRADYRF